MTGAGACTMNSGWRGEGGVEWVADIVPPQLLKGG
jgi:hypothetical protein